MKTKLSILLASMLACSAGIPLQAQLNTNPSTTRRATVNMQNDSIIIRKGTGDLHIKIFEELNDGEESRKEEIFDGTYVETIDTERNTFVDALPFIPKRKRYTSYEPHCSGVFIGYSWLTRDFFQFRGTRRAPLDLSQSWEFGFNLLCVHQNFKKNPHWGVNAGISWGYRSFNIADNLALLKTEDGTSAFVASNDEVQYSKSRLRHFFFRIPVLLEWQQRTHRRHLVFANAGVEFEVRHGVKSFSHIDGGKKHCVGKGMYVQPVGVNLLAQAGYGNIGLYLRYSATRLFQKDKGPEVNPFSFGIAWYW